jgi:hypothetical protein
MIRNIILYSPKYDRIYVYACAYTKRMRKSLRSYNLTFIGFV